MDLKYICIHGEHGEHGDHGEHDHGSHDNDDPHRVILKWTN